MRPSIVAVLVLSAAPRPAFAQEAVAASSASVSSRLDALEQRQKTLEDRLSLGEAKAGVRLDGRPVVKVNPGGPDGFSLQSADGDFELRIGGVVQADDRTFLNRESASAGAVDQFLVRRARIYLEGVVQKYVQFRVLPDFAAGQALLQEAWLDLDYTPVFRVQAGKFKEPLGLERLQAEADTLFIERGLPSDLAPNRDVGVRIHGDAAAKTLGYSVALVDGAPDGGAVDGDADNSKDVVARVFARPFRPQGSPVWSDLGLGVAGSLGRQNGSSSASGLPTYDTEPQQSFFTYLSGVQANGVRRRLSPQAYWYPRNFGLLGEYVESQQALTRTTGAPAAETLTSRSWQVAGSWVLTGEKTSFDGLKPKRPFDPKAGGLGAWEIAVRYSALWVDSDAFPRFASPAASSRRADAWTGGVNWYLNS
ncbi:MAG TPA: porin, partial [Elusimicrobiota bacterium]|nr:porin [Elusimicrobiota bacterium]